MELQNILDTIEILKSKAYDECNVKVKCADTLTDIFTTNYIITEVI